MRFGIIGNDQMLLSCLQHLLQRDDAEIRFVYYDVRRAGSLDPIGRFCREKGLQAEGITKLHVPENVDLIRQQRPDFILSINNFWVVRQEILDLPTVATINFHNSVPGRYHGLNIPSWVILNGESTHGAMWHFVEAGIDTGDVISWEEFALTPHETAARLMVTCVKKGIEMFPGVINQLYSGKINRTKQQPNASYYGKRDLPKNGGYIDFSVSGQEIDRLVRGLNYLPFANPFCFAKLRANDREAIVNAVSIEKASAGQEPGTVIAVGDREVRIRCGDSDVVIVDAMDMNQNGCNGGMLASALRIKAGYTVS